MRGGYPSREGLEGVERVRLEGVEGGCGEGACGGYPSSDVIWG